MKFSFKKTTINLFFLFSLAIFSILITRSHTPYGAAMSMDSLSYLNAAQQFTLGHGASLSNYNLDEKDYTPMTLWPPLYPLTLSALIPPSKIFSVGVGIQIAWINAFALFATTALFWFLCKKFFRREIAFVASLLLAFLPSIQLIYMYGWSETIFIPVVLLAFYFQWKFFVTDPIYQTRWLCAAALVLTVAFYTRYASLGFFGGFLACIIFAGKFTFHQRLRWVATVIVVFSIAVVPLLVRNYSLTSNFIGYREKPVANLLEDLDLLGYFLRDEFFPFPAICLLIIPVWLLCVVTVIKKMDKQGSEDKKENMYGSQGFLFPILSFVWCLIYLLFLIVNRQLSIMDLDPRMIGPIVPFFIMGVGISLGYLTQLTKPILITFPVSLLVMFLFFRSYGVHTEIISSWKSTGTPGVIQNIEYKTVLSQATKPLQQLQKSISLPPGSILLTDIEPTSFVQYFFPLAHVKLLPKNVSEDVFRLPAFTEQVGLVVLTKHDSIALFNKVFGSTNALFQIDEEGLSYFVLMKLPIGKN